jgi:hypothetical protein
MKVEILMTENETLNKIAVERGREIKKREEEIGRLEENLRKVLKENEKLNELVGEGGGEKEEWEGKMEEMVK